MDAEYINGAEQPFPRRTLRFHLNSQKLIAGTAFVVRDDGSTTQELHRASVWRFDGGSGSLPSGWRRIPMEAEPGDPDELLEDPFESLVGDLNHQGVVGGAKSWHPTYEWLVTPAAWSYDITDDGVDTHRLGTTGSTGQQQFYQDNYCPGVVCAVASGTTPRLGGWIGTRCSASAPAPFTASLTDSTLAIAELDNLIPGLPGLDPPKRRVSALPAPSGSDPVRAVGYAHGGACFGPSFGLCAPDVQFNSWPTRWELSGSSWGLSAVATPFHDADGFDFKLFDSTSTLGGGYVRWFGTPESDECEDHAVVFYDPLNTDDLSYDIHDALPLDEDRPRSRIASVVDVGAGGVLWLAVGSQYQYAETGSASTYDLARGVIWQSREGEEEGLVEWCGRKIQDITRNVPERVLVFACTDVLPGGAVIGFGRLQSGGTQPSGWGDPGGKLILFTAAADYNGDLNVDGADLGTLLGEWNTNNSDVALECENDLIDGADLGLLLGAWASGSNIATIGWDCKGWTTGTLVEAAEEAARSMGFDDLDDMGLYLSVVSSSTATDTAEIAAILTQALIGGGQ